MDDRVTHGLCPNCLLAEPRRIKKEMAGPYMGSADSEKENTYPKAAI